MKTHKKGDCRFSHGIAVLVIDACNVLQAGRPCWFWCSIWLYRNACNLGWAGCHVAKDPKLWAACVWLWLLGHTGAAPLQERPCEELAWGWLAVVVQWCCQGIEYGVVWWPVHVAGHVAVSMLPSSCLKEESAWFETCEAQIQALMGRTVWLFPT